MPRACGSIGAAVFKALAEPKNTSCRARDIGEVRCRSGDDRPGLLARLVENAMREFNKGTRTSRSSLALRKTWFRHHDLEMMGRPLRESERGASSKGSTEARSATDATPGPGLGLYSPVRLPWQMEEIWCCADNSASGVVVSATVQLPALRAHIAEYARCSS